MTDPEALHTTDAGEARVGSAPAPTALLGLAGALLLMAVFALLVDLQVAELCRERCIRGDVGKLISLSEAFAHGMGVAVILLAVVVLDPAGRPHVPRLLVLAFGAGLACDLVKVLVPRSRPDFGPLPETALSSFVGWGPAEGREGFDRILESGIQSFPSGHTTVAVGLAIGLAWLYPRGRWYFVFLALLAGMERIVSGSHYPSDVLGGAALACVVAAICFSNGRVGGWFDRFEAGRQAASRASRAAAGGG